jgi:heme oxygenase
VSHPDRLTEPNEQRSHSVPALLARLREATRAAHDEIERLPELACLQSPDLRPPEYVHALRGLHAFHACMSRALPPLLAGLADGMTSPGPDGGALRALQEDLAWFGAKPPRMMRKPASLVDAQAALGALYVVEGSALGARVIGRAVSASVHAAPGKGGSFFCGTSADTARRNWLAFCTLLEGVDRELDEAGRLRVVRGALDGFAALAASMAQSHEAPHTSPPVLRADKNAWTEESVRSLN